MCGKRVIHPLGSTGSFKRKESCELCGRSFLSHLSVKCINCKKIFCRRCVTKNPVDKSHLLCLTCAMRSVLPKKAAHRYFVFSDYLERKSQRKNLIRINFKEIEEITSNNLPSIAFKNKAWWKKKFSEKHFLGKGWNIKDVDFKNENLILLRTRGIKNQKLGTRKTSSKLLQKYRSRKNKRVSLTKIAHAQAKLRNIAIKKRAEKKYKGKFGKFSFKS